MSNIKQCFTAKWYKATRARSLVLMLFLMASLVSSGNAVSYEHAHLTSNAEVVKTSTHDANSHKHGKASHGAHHAAFSDNVTTSPKPSSTHCQQQSMPSQKVGSINDTEVTPRAIVDLEPDVACCKDDCQCPSGHCFNTGASALLQPVIQTHIAVATMAAITPILGQYSTLHFGQFRPPKSLFTA
ncbi:hypothetical protein [Alteromonas sp. KUL150]|uniref:hypothetical protein n=1 Tax=Alteromonas sp. KUL150 TaxID=2480805 RepID=UPI001F1E17D4|nr:hypothetical protein [Alteromonas sp. KUL150]